jgi:dipeptidyl aminopeptidase/acylaminoacyl peptidase
MQEARMAELREVYEMTTKQMEPDQDSWREQEERHHRDVRRKRVGALAVAATVAILAGVGIVWSLDGDDAGEETTPATVGTDTTDLGSGSYQVDLPSGAVTVIQAPYATGVGDVSPDGTSIANAGNKVTVTDLEGDNVRAFDSTRTSQGTDAPRWSPDGRTIVYQVHGPNEKIGNLFALDVASEKVTQLTDLEQIRSGLWYMAPSYSPDGRSILFTSPTGKDDRQVWHLWSIPSSGGEPTIVLRDAAFGEYSPDGSTIAYVRVTEGGEEAARGLWIANADGSDRQRLVAGELVFPRWSPDGTRIVYGNDGENRTYVYDVATGETTSVAGVSTWPEWVDDDTLLVD